MTQRNGIDRPYWPQGAEAGTISPAVMVDAGWRSLRRDVFRFVGLCAAVWIALYLIWRELPELRNGADAIAAAKVQEVLTQPIFTTDGPRVLAIGDSRILAGFNPAVFDADSPPGTSSFNMARPGNSDFLILLEGMLANGVRPNWLLVEVPPTGEHHLTWLDYAKHDALTIRALFPFRDLPRDLVVFLITSAREGGPLAAYRNNAATVAKMIRDRGYYFIKGQSMFPSGALPDDFKVPGDGLHPISELTPDPGAPAFATLRSLAAKYGFKVVFIPSVYRQTEMPGSASQPDDLRAIAGLPGFYKIGDGRWTLPPGDFSDVVHLNQAGAGLYSKRLADILGPILRADN